MNRQGSLKQYADEDGSDIQQFMNVRDEAKSIVSHTDTAMRRPEETSRWFATTGDAILDHVAQAQKKIVGRSNNEFLSTVTDLKLLAWLARFHSWRLLAGVGYNLYTQTGNLADFDDAIVAERHALESWKEMVDAAGDVYSPNLAFGVHAVGFSRHWKEEYSLLARDFEQLLAERTKTHGKEGPRHELFSAVLLPPTVQLATSTAIAEQGRDFVVSARVEAPEGVKWVRLRYRHVSQIEDYQSAEMSLDSKNGLYVGRIPASFIDPKWDLMYFVETVDKKGAGRIYPDLEVEAPYVVVAVKR